MSDVREMLSALIDREPVDPDVLAQLLEDASNRRLLVDFVRVRMATLEDEREDEPPLAAADYPRTPSGPSHGSHWLRAAAVFLLLAAGAGGAWLERYASRDRPPNPDRIVRLEPIPAPPMTRTPAVLDGRHQ